MQRPRRCSRKRACGTSLQYFLRTHSLIGGAFLVPPPGISLPDAAVVVLASGCNPGLLAGICQQAPGSSPATFLMLAGYPGVFA